MSATDTLLKIREHLDAIRAILDDESITNPYDRRDALEPHDWALPDLIKDLDDSLTDGAELPLPWAVGGRWDRKPTRRSRRS